MALNLVKIGIFFKGQIQNLQLICDWRPLVLKDQFNFISPTSFFLKN